MASLAHNHGRQRVPSHCSAPPRSAGPASQRNAAFRKIGDLDGDVSADWWSADGKTIYFNEGFKATQQLFALDVASGKVKAVTDVKGVIAVTQDEATKRLMVSYQDPTTTPSLFTVASLAALVFLARAA